MEPTKATKPYPEEQRRILLELVAERLHIFAEHAVQLHEISIQGYCKSSVDYRELDEYDKNNLRAEANAILNLSSAVPASIVDTCEQNCMKDGFYLKG